MAPRRFGCLPSVLRSPRATDIPRTEGRYYARPIDKSGGHNYIQSMTTTALLLREIETMPEETAVEVLDFAMFLKNKQTSLKQVGTGKLPVPKTKDANGIFKGINTHFERDEDDRV